MADSKPPLWVRIVTKVPFLTRMCPFNKPHWRWNRICACGFGFVHTHKPGEAHAEDCMTWHGGVFDFKYGTELQLCTACMPEAGQVSHQWPLSKEEECILAAWRAYRQEVLDSYGEKLPYHYDLNVKLNGAEMFLMSRTQGAAVLLEANPRQLAQPSAGEKPKLN